MDEIFEEIPPRADAMIVSLRAIGYDLPMAIADLIDNSISAKASHVWITYKWQGKKSWICILDDGYGMAEEQLKEAMRIGSRNPNEKRNPEDLGRFGLGLKTASFSQCKRLTVKTKTSKNNPSVRVWDLDHVEKSNKWELGKTIGNESKKLLSPLDELEHGTLVLWQKLDRIISEPDKENEEEQRDAFYEKFSLNVKPELEMIYHKFLAPPDNFSINVGRDSLRPWDPYLLKNSFTQKLSKEKYDDGAVQLVPYVLPHVSKRTPQENLTAGGIKGWNLQQGFYIYRNERLIVPGGYLDFQLNAEEHYKLARIKLDISNEMDQEWKIDIRKATARPPDRLRQEIEKVAKATRTKASNVYKARTGTSQGYSKRNTDKIWVKKRVGDKIVYKINRDSEMIKLLLNETNPPQNWTNKFFHTLESTIPYRLIILDNSELEDCHVDLPVDQTKPNNDMLHICELFYRKQRKNGRSHMEAVDLVSSIEPFNTHPSYRAFLENLDY